MNNTQMLFCYTLNPILSTRYLIQGSARILFLVNICIVFSLVSAFSQKKKTYKMGLGVCLCVCVCVCVCVCLCNVLVPPNNFHTSYPIDTKFWLRTVSCGNSPALLIPFLNFENCAREKFLKLIFFI